MSWKEYVMERVYHGKSMSWQDTGLIIKKTVKLVKEFGGHPGMNMRLSRLSSRIFSLH
jgi:hypothetical protein